MAAIRFGPILGGVKLGSALNMKAGIDWSASSYEAVLAAHRWSIPERLNIAVAACDRHADGSGRAALYELSEGEEAPRVTSFDELARDSGRLARSLAELGVERGDRVAVFLPQCRETALAHLATLKLGAISVPLSPLFRAEALSHRLADSGAKVLFTDEELAPHIAPLRARLPALGSVIERKGVAELVADAVAPLAAVDTAADDPAMLIYTSGTTGLPRGALHAHRFLPGRLSGFELIHQLERGPHRDRPFWTPADWAWVGGLVDCVLTPWVFATPVLALCRRGFDPEAAFAAIEKTRVRSLFLPPTALHRLATASDDVRRKGRAVFSVHTAGEPLSPETYRFASETFGAVYELYGMTEVGAVAGSSAFVPVRPGSLGKPYPGHDVALLDDRGRPISGEGEGQLAVRRGDPGMFIGYFRDPAATEARFSGDWLTTGDVARRDRDGYLFYLGRNDDVFNTSGYRVGPTEIEASIGLHPAVLEAAVVGEPDADRGAVVKAFVVLRPGFSPSEELTREIQSFVKERLAAYEYPRRIVFARELPRTVTGKVRRSELRAADADQRFAFAKP
jgi:acetyl-CoA synthetase